MSSVVQGSVLGPILFTIFINDLDLSIEDPSTKIYKYADDSKFGRPIQNQSDAANLQSTIDSIYRWSKRWGMEIHPQKTCVMHFGYGNPKFSYSLNGNKIEEVTSARDLGVVVNDSCTPSEHVPMITRKANGVLSQIRRTLVSRSKDVVVNLFKVFVRPILESAGPSLFRLLGSASGI